jgi:prolyl-tRNA editing enzyme YbaK/EbsC (Cys-tRNA(Pro) deacylase)
MSSLVPTSLTAAHPLVASAIERYGLTATVVECDAELADTAQFCAAYDVSPQDSANTIVVIGKSAEPVLVACLVLATTRLDVNGAVRRRLGVKKASFAAQTQACEATGMEYGGVTAVGLPDGMELWIDAAVMTRNELIVGGGNRTSKLLLAPAELLRLPGTSVVDGLANPLSAE